MEEYVNRIEFDALRQEVNEIKQEMAESSKLLQAIDKKIDIIDAKIISSDQIDNLKLTPLEKRVENLEENRKWLWRTLAGAIITTIVGVIIFVIKQM